MLEFFIFAALSLSHTHTPVSPQHGVHRVLEAQHDQQRQFDQLGYARAWRRDLRSGGIPAATAAAELGAHLSRARIFPSLVVRVHSLLSPRRRRRRRSAGAGGGTGVSRVHARRSPQRVPCGGEPVTSVLMGSDVCGITSPNAIVIPKGQVDLNRECRYSSSRARGVEDELLPNSQWSVTQEEREERSFALRVACESTPKNDVGDHLITTYVVCQARLAFCGRTSHALFFWVSHEHKGFY